MNTYTKYLNTSIRDFDDIIKLLHEDGIADITEKDNYSFFVTQDHSNPSMQYDKLIIEFLKIQKQNKVTNLKYLFDAEVKSDFFVQVPLKNLFEVENDNTSFQRHIISPYVKSYKYCREMIDPLRQALLLRDNYCFNYPISLNKEHSELELVIYTYSDNSNNQLEIVETNQVSKNPIYGIYKLWNLDTDLFHHRSILLYKLTQKFINKEQVRKVKVFFDHITTSNFIFDFQCIEDYGNNIFSNLYFYDHPDSKNKILSLENFERNFLIEVFSNIYTIEAILKYLQEKNIYLSLHFNKDNLINVYIYKEHETTNFTFSLDSNLISCFFRDILAIEKISFLQMLKYFFIGLEEQEVINRNFYYRNRQKFLYLKNLI